jgi:serpin B
MTMKLFYLVPILPALLLTTCKSGQNLSQKNIDAASPATYTAAESINNLGLDVYKKLSTKEENLFISPLSISSAMAMTYAGASGNTATEMQKSLYYNNNTWATHMSFGKTVNSIIPQKQGKNLELRLANALFIQQDYTILPHFDSLLTEAYHSEPFRVDYISTENREKARTKINSWVEEQTHDKIKEIIPKNILSELTRLVLVNAIYFYSPWLKEFKKSSTNEGLFFSRPDETHSAKFMHAELTIPYYENELVQMISLPYRDSSFSMLVILPRYQADHSLPTFNPDWKTLKKMISSLHDQKVDLALPRFKLEYKCELNETLKALGVNLAFTDNADFSGISGQDDLKIDKVLHKTFIEVNEKGTEAAGSTAVIMNLKAMAIPEDVYIFKADHPFLFFIRHNPSNSILFLGKLVVPN